MPSFSELEKQFKFNEPDLLLIQVQRSVQSLPLPKRLYRYIELTSL